MSDSHFKILYFSANTCAACPVVFDKLLQLLQRDFPRCVIQEYPVESCGELAAAHGVFSAPTILLMIDGKETFRAGATISMSQLAQKIRRYYDIYFR